MNDTTLVTLFYNIGRENWKSFPRSVDQYLDAFDIFLNYDNEMIIFIDDRYYETIESKVRKSKFDNKKVLPINLDWLKNNIWAWQKLEREKEIINDQIYKNLVKNRVERSYPENTDPYYTILTHSKIDIVNYAIESNLLKTRFVGWVDFGYFHNKSTQDFLPKGTFNSEKLNPDKVNICLINPIEEIDKNIVYTIQNAPEKIGAYFFWSNRDKLKEFQSLCHKWLEYFQSINIADDEQHLWLQCYFEKPSLFELHTFYKWHQAMKVFS
jgi:protein YibB